MQVVFAVVLGGGLIQFNDILFPPRFSTIEFWALFGVYATSIMSWTGYHHRITDYNYTHTKSGILRLFTDVFIVIMYAFLLFAGTRQGQSIETYLWVFSIVFLLYSVSGWLRRKEYSDKKASNIPMLLVFLSLFVAVSLLFTILLRFTCSDVTILNWSFIFLPFLLMLAFRYFHEWRKLKWKT